MEPIAAVAEREKERHSRRRSSSGRTLPPPKPIPFPREQTRQDWEAYRAAVEERPVTQLCPVCKSNEVVFRLAQGQWPDALVYPIGTTAKHVMMPCPSCGTAARKRWIARNCGLEVREQRTKMIAWLCPPFLEHPDWTGQRQFARSVIEQAIVDRAGLFTFWGDFGSGKTMAAQIVVNEMRNLHITEGYYATMAQILDHLRSLYAAHADSSAFWQRLLDVPVLAIDEVTRFKETDWSRQQLFMLVDTRWRRRHSHLTVFTTNDDPNAELPPDEPIGYLFSRMRQGVLVELRGDVRKAVGDR